MTNPIPGADIERAACEASFMRSRRMAAPPARASDPAKIEDGADYEGTAVECYWQGWQARAAAKVGANVAMPAPWVKEGDAMDCVAQRDYFTEDQMEKYADACIAAGAPAETPKPCPACDGKGGWVTAEWTDPVSGPESEGERCGDCEGTGIASPAPIAGDVEKDAAKVAIETFEMLIEFIKDASIEEAQWHWEPYERARAAIAMLANSSSGEAG